METPSSVNLNLLPGPERLRSLMQSLALLDAILSPEWESRYYSFDSDWSETEQMGSMRNGSGDEFFVLFNSAGAFVKGFAHEYPHAKIPTSQLDVVPDSFSSAVQEPAFSMDQTTFSYWRFFETEQWSDISNQPENDGSSQLLAHLDGNPQTYLEFAEDYYEQQLPIEPIQNIYAHQPITSEVVSALNPMLTFRALQEDLEQIGYPLE